MYKEMMNAMYGKGAINKHNLGSMNYPLGVMITIQVKICLFNEIYKIKEDFICADTDSIKKGV